MFSIYLLDSSKLFQWDLNRKIKIIGKEEVDEVHFSHIGDEEALVVKPIKENNVLIANIPNILLQENKDIFVYLVSKDKTLKETFFTVGRREKPTDYLYTEIDILNYSSLEKRLAELEEKVKNISVEETDPTVPDWAKQPDKPRYTAAEVGALSSTETVRQLAQKQDKSNLVTSINESSVDSTYPSTRAVYEYVGEEFARLVGGAPDALNTIEELAAAFNNNPDILDTLNASIINKQDKTDSVGVKTTQGGEIFNDYQNNTASREYSHAEGVSTKAYGRGSHAEGENAEALGDYSHAEGRMTRTVGRGSHSEGDSTIAGNPTATLSNDISELSTYEQQVPGAAAHAEGIGSIANKSASHAEGFKTQALGEASHSEGQNTTASSKGAHAEGLDTIAEGDYSHAEGCSNGNIMTIASGKGSHAEGIGNWAIGKGSHAEGNNNSASKDYSHAEGDSTTASGTASHTEGKGTIANSSFQHVQGKYNIEDTANKYAHIVGNGSSVNARSNAHTVDWDGNAEFQGDVKAKACGGNSPISLVDTANALANKINSPATAEVGQQLIVKEVDENGKPIEWKTIDPTHYIEYVTHSSLENYSILPTDEIQEFTMEKIGYTENKRRKFFSNSYFEFNFNGEKFLYEVEIDIDGGALNLDANKTLFQYNGLDVILKTMKPNRRTGVYDFVFCFSDVLDTSVTVNAYYKQRIYHQLDERFIPITIPRISNATVGQFIGVGFVDENGKPIQWEAYDKPTYTAEEVGALPADTEIPSIEGLASEEYVDEKVNKAKVQSDWNQNDKDALDYIKNKPFYAADSEVGEVIETLQMGMNLIHDLSHVNSSKLTTYFGYDYLINSDGKFQIIVNFELIMGNSSIKTSTTYNKNNTILIDSKNSKYCNSDNCNIYYIIDLNTLTDEYKDKFNTVGVYVEILKEGWATATKNYQSKLIEYVQLSRRYIPATIARTDYVDNKIADLVNSAPETLDTIGELATAFNENKEVVDALNEAITNKANASDLTAHTDDTTIHVTAEEKAAWNSVEAIIDVVALPTENIVENNFYRSLKVDCVYYKGIQNDFIIYAVETLPETGEVVTDAEISFLKFYFSVENNEAYGYVDETLAAAHGFPITGWIDFETMINAAGGTYGGVIKHIDDAKEDEVWYILLSHSLHIYKDGWKELPYAYESEPEFDIKWDGVIGDKFALDMSPLGYEHHFMVKVSDEVIELEQLKNARMFYSHGGSLDLSDVNASIDTEMYPGAITIENGEAVIVYSAEDTNTALGLPDGYLTNGVYFLYTEELMEDDIVQPETWTARLVAKSQITKIDIKYIDVEPICEEVYWDIYNSLHRVAFSGNYSDLANKPNLKTVATSGSYNDLSNKPTIYTDVIRYNATQYLSSTSKSTARSNIDVYSKSEVDDKIANSSSNVDLTGYAKTADVATMITEAIGSAIGGSY